MSSTNGFHPPSVSTACNETSKRLPSTSSTSSTSSNSTLVVNKRKMATSIVTETRTMKKHANKINKKRHHHHHHHSANDSNNNSTKKIATESSPLLTHPIIHHQKKSSSQTPNIPSNNSHQHVINNDHCDSCGELYGEMISCDTCPATFHLLCANPPLSREDVPKGSYFCENCRAKKAEETSIVLSESKKKILTNGLKKNPPRQTTLGQLKLPTESNGRSLIQPSGEIKFRATSHSIKSNLKRKRIDSTSSSSPPSTHLGNHSHSTVKIPTTQIETLRRLLISCRPEEFRGPSLPFDDPTFNREHFFQKNSLSWQNYCFICRKSSTNHHHLPSIHCDYCPLTYHLDCLTPPMTALPSTGEKWMCPNHIEPILDRYLMKKKKYLTSERVKIYRQYAQIEQKTILQEFARMRQTKNDLLTKTRDQQRLQRIEISQIPKVIEQFYLNANTTCQQIEEENDSDHIEEECLQTHISPESPSSNYDPCVWDLLQSILDDVVDGRVYEYSSIAVCSLPIERKPLESNVIDGIDRLLNALNEPNYPSTIKPNTCDAFSALIAAADSCLTNDKTSLDLPSSLTHSLSLLIDLSQFRSSHAALIHTRSKHVIYLRKHVIWFGSSKSNDICLKSFNSEQSCQYVSERHACLYYDRKRNLFELLNYSEYGTIVNGLRYGLGNLSDDDDDDDEDLTNIENENLQKCFCLTNPLYHSAWDGPAQLEQGTVVQIGCHEFLFYRHVVR